MKLGLPKSIVTANWLFENKDNPNLIVLDASLKKVVNALEGLTISEPVVIPGSLYFDIEGKFSDQNTSLPHMMISADEFTRECQNLGITQNSSVVVYDNLGIYSSPRVWWMLKSMGHKDVAVLDGGLPAWLAKNYSVQNHHETSVPKGNFKSQPMLESFCDQTFVRRAINSNEYLVLDARSEGRFQGTEKEPRPGIRSGHIPNSRNLPFTRVLNGSYLKSFEDLRTIFESQSLDNKKLIMTCGSGVTACILALAADVAGYSDISVYDGSWSEWGQ